MSVSSVVPINGPRLSLLYEKHRDCPTVSPRCQASTSNFGSVPNSPLAPSASAHCSCTSRKATSQDCPLLPWNSAGKTHSLHVSIYTLPAFPLLTTTLASSHNHPPWLWAVFPLHTRRQQELHKLSCIIHITNDSAHKPFFASVRAEATFPLPNSVSLVTIIPL